MHTIILQQGPWDPDGPEHNERPTIEGAQTVILILVAVIFWLLATRKRK